MIQLFEYLTFNQAPLSGLFVGILLVALFLYLYVLKKNMAVAWIAKHIFRNQFMSEKSAEGLFDVLTSFIVTIGGLWIILAIYYLSN